MHIIRTLFLSWDIEKSSLIALQCSDARSRGKPRHPANLLISHDKNSVLIICIIVVAVFLARVVAIYKLIPKTIGNRKRDCAWGCAWGINTTWENLQIEKHKSVRWAEHTPSWFVLFDLQIFSGGVYPQAQPHAQSLFLFPIVFGINLIHFFDFFDIKKNGAVGNSIVCFAASIACQSRHVTVRRMRTVSKSATFLATESVNSAPFKTGKTEVQIFWQGKAQNSSPILKCTFLARRSAKLIANFSATMVMSLPSFSLCLSLSLSLSLSHRMYLTHNIGSASALPIIVPLLTFLQETQAVIVLQA